ncbi:MAG: SPASM domain-containing protein [Pseudonocardiales bacterium]|nr:SPASM domain-containing protein [Pseudonocardiales bacterium]MBV9029941.1 SPASM domain-containing protein [Pseudonocardiales bacterium]MBW0009502.1 SPASM domain-containing protein [Pseudonocardiales bacterium]
MGRRGLTPSRLSTGGRRDALCGQCGNVRAAIGPDGTVHPCVLGRFLSAGNVDEQSLQTFWRGRAGARSRLASHPGTPVSPARRPTRTTVTRQEAEMAR